VQVSDDPRVGTELAGYRIVSLLGLGGMGVVYLAEDLRLKRRVALKLLAAGLAEDGEVLGPSPAPLPRIRGRFRWQILVKEREDMRARTRLRTLLTEIDLPRAVKVIVDVDPVDLL